MVLRRGTGGYLTHGLVARWQRQGISIRDQQSGDHLAGDSLRVVNLLLAENGANYDDDAGSNFGKVAAFAAANHVTVAGPVTALLQSLDPASASFVQPVDGSAAADVSGTVAIPAEFLANYFGGTLTPADYYGAVAPSGTPWYAGWTNYAQD